MEYDAPISPWVIIAGWFSMILGVCSSPYLSLRRQICFLDMTSIHQSDNELLQRGIYSIGGCLSVSKELRVLYSPPYFGSLWCLFELVAFRNSNPTGKIKFLPLFLERSVLVGAFCLCSHSVGGQLRFRFPVRKSAVGQPSQPSHDPFSHVHGTCNTSELWGEDAADGRLEILRPGEGVMCFRL